MRRSSILQPRTGCIGSAVDSMISIDNCGLMLEPQLGMSVEEIVEWAKYAEKSGYGYLMRSDHLLPTVQTKRMIDSPECWVTLGIIAACTKRIKFGPLVSLIGFRNPALLARMACTLDSYANGRLVLGVGAGWFEEEYISHGYKFPRFRVRKNQFLEAVKIIRPLTEGASVNFSGKYYTAHTTCDPKPESKIPLIIGGRSREVIETAARYADEFNIYNSTSDVFTKYKKLLDSENSQRKVEVSQMVPFVIGENQRDLELRIAQYSKLIGRSMTEKKLRKSGVMCGKTDEFMSQLDEFTKIGAQRFYFQVLPATDKEMIYLLTDMLKSC